MTRQQITFLLAGLIAGAITVAAGRVSLWVLTVGVGPLFFVAILAGIAFTHSWQHLGPGLWRYVLTAFASTMAYVLALLTFWWLGGYLQNLMGNRGSTDLSDFHLDMWIGLIAAALVAAVCIEVMAYLLTGGWSNDVLVQLAGACNRAHLHRRARCSVHRDSALPALLLVVFRQSLCLRRGAFFQACRGATLQGSAKTVFSIATVLALGLCSASLAQDADYYKAIQKRSSTRVRPAQFEQIEENALKDFSRPES